MKAAVRNEARKRHYKVRIVREGDRKVRHIEYVWARSAREAEQIIRNQTRKGDKKVVKVKAGVLL